MRTPKPLIGALALAFLFSTSAHAQKGRSSSSSRPSGGSSKPSSGGSMFGGSKLDFGWKFAEENNFLDVLADEEGVFKILADRDGNPI